MTDERTQSTIMRLNSPHCTVQQAGGRDFTRSYQDLSMAPLHLERGIVELFHHTGDDQEHDQDTLKMPYKPLLSWRDSMEATIPGKSQKPPADTDLLLPGYYILPLLRHLG